MKNVSIYFPAGDFADVLRRYDEGREQSYQTHNEVARLIYDLLAEDMRVNIFSFVTPEAREEMVKGARIVSLGAKDFSVKGLLKRSVSEGSADAIVAHFPSLELLRAATATQARVFAVLASSYNRRGLRSALNKWRISSALNDRRIELVSNHCLPATEHLARVGVKREKLIPWDISHPCEPGSQEPKELVARRRYEAFYAGSIVEGKGVAEIIRAVAILRKQDLEVHCSLAGQGNIDAMRSLAAALGVSDLISFAGLIGNSQVFGMMVGADLVVVPSRTAAPEGLPLALFEAIASRTPIVCSNHPMFRDLVDGLNASVFPAGDHLGLAAAIRRTLNDPVLYATLSANADKTWAALKGPADWRTMIHKWVVEGSSSSWIRAHKLIALKDRTRD